MQNRCWARMVGPHSHYEPAAVATFSMAKASMLGLRTTRLFVGTRSRHAVWSPAQRSRCRAKYPAFAAQPTTPALGCRGLPQRRSIGTRAARRTADTWLAMFRPTEAHARMPPGWRCLAFTLVLSAGLLLAMTFANRRSDPIQAT